MVQQPLLEHTKLKGFVHMPAKWKTIILVLQQNFDRKELTQTAQINLQHVKVQHNVSVHWD